ncbi:M-Phase Inducer Phosphatase 2 [Manis pentadactyla]|nr:M-Phase Inducer Phosphatase 2 [Manis pentadactyla]
MLIILFRVSICNQISISFLITQMANVIHHLLITTEKEDIGDTCKLFLFSELNGKPHHLKGTGIFVDKCK